MTSSNSSPKAALSKTENFNRTSPDSISQITIVDNISSFDNILQSIESFAKRMFSLSCILPHQDQIDREKCPLFIRNINGIWLSFVLHNKNPKLLSTTPFKVFFLAFLQAHVRLQYDGFVWRFFLLAVASSGLVFSWDTLRVSLDRPAL